MSGFPIKPIYPIDLRVGPGLKVSRASTGTSLLLEFDDLMKAGNPLSDAVGEVRRAALSGNYPVMALGYFGDGERHPLSKVTSCQGRNTANWPLLLWIGLFPNAISLDNEIDGLAIQKYWDTRPIGGDLRLPDGTGFSSLEIKTGGKQTVSYTGNHRDVCNLVFLNSIASGGGGYGISHGRTIKADGTFAMQNMSILCSGGVFQTAITVRFSGEQFDRSWCYRMNHVLIKGLNYTFGFPQPAVPDYWAQATVTYDIVRGLTWYDVVSITANPEINPSDHHTLIVDYVNRASNSYNYFNCACWGGAYAWKFSYNGKARTQTHEEAQFWNCQGYDVIGLCHNRTVNYSAPYSDNFTFYECQCASRGGPIFYFERTELVTIVGGLYGNNIALNSVQTLFARINSCSAFKVYWPHIINSDFGGAPQNFYHFYVEGIGCKEITVQDYTVTNYGNFGAFVGFANSDADRVPPGAWRDRGVQFNVGGPEPTIAWVDDPTNGQLSELRIRQAFAAAQRLGYVTPQGSIEIDGACTATIRDTFESPLDVNGGTIYQLLPGMVRKRPNCFPVNADITPRDGWVGAAAAGLFRPIDDNDAKALVRIGYAGGAGKRALTSIQVTWSGG